MGGNVISSAFKSGIEFVLEDLDEDVDAEEYVVAEQIRRNLTAGQRAALAAAWMTTTRGRPKKSGIPEIRTLDQAAVRWAVNSDSITIFRKLRDRGPDLAEKVRLGEMSLNAAEEALEKGKPPGKKKGGTDWLGRIWIAATRRPKEVESDFDDGFDAPLIGFRTEIEAVCDEVKHDEAMTICRQARDDPVVLKHQLPDKIAYLNKRIEEEQAG